MDTHTQHDPNNPINFNDEEPPRCKICDNILQPEEIQEDETEICDECFFSCCGDELDQDLRICPTCKEHN